MFNFLKKKKEPAHLCVSTDIHCHLVPGVDDGARDAATAAEIIERMQSWGVKRIIASPHVTQDTFENTPEELDKALQRAFSCDGTYLVECIIDKDEFVLPMLPPGGSMDDIIVKVGD